MKLECCSPSYISTVNGRPEILGVLIRHSERLSSVLCFIRSSLQRLPKSKLHIDTTECMATRSHLHVGHRGGRAQEPDRAAGAKEGQGESRAITVVVWPNERRQGGNHYQEVSSVSNLGLHEVSVRESSSPSTAVSQRPNL